MKFSRRKFLASISAAGLVIPGIYYGQREIRSRLISNDKEVTPGEAVVEPATDNGERLAGRLRGIWDFRLLGGSGSLGSLSQDDLEMVLDVGATGRALRGYLGTAVALRGDSEPDYRITGSLINIEGAKLRWLICESDTPRYECDVILDEVWSNWSNAGDGTLSGKMRDLNRSLQLPDRQYAFIARKHRFPEAKERITYTPVLQEWLVSAEHRLFHQVWHASRDKWHRLPEEKREALRGLNWQPGPVGNERDARGKNKHRNGSGEDFLFMHRDMVRRARALQPDLMCWSRLPSPVPFIECDRQEFIRYYENSDGCSVPPAWEPQNDAEYAQWLRGVKGSASFYSNYQVWESLYQDPEYLSRMTLGEFGSELELGIHDWLHMRWATVTRDPSNGMPLFWDRNYTDFSSRWFLPENDYLGDPFSSHVNPVFWMFHGWIDDRIEDWFRAHERVHPGEVKRQIVKGVPWFAPGRWVQVGDPWLGAVLYGCVPPGEGGGAVALNTGEMKLALRIAFSGEEDVSNLLKRTPRRPWYARNLKLA
ncbi:pyoverdine maturation tyrosinase PvdP [Oceanobacter antarcticus]|uniref:PvdJ/PvdD/PvdP-like protein n=1 Tax=Oceanobacter antarcticus TaxID=3133425 RepID=A0ABW8NN59_9GAMM